jgi:hypothetical protein
MPRIAVRRVGKGAGWSLEPKRYEKALRDAVNKEAKPAVLKMMKEVVEGKRYSESGDAWKHKVQFKARFQVRGNDAVLYAFPTGKNKKYWTWTSRGTKPHSIDAKNAPFLVFPYGGPGQAPKTRPPRGSGRSFGGPGVTKWARVKHVDHPGTKARLFEEQIMKEYAPKFRRLVRKTIDDLINEKNGPYIGAISFAN